MTKSLIFATHNLHKSKEIAALLPNVKLLTLTDVGITEEIPENEDTLAGNALAKARFVHQKKGENCFSDDTGLEVEALNGAPGVYSARYAGEAKNSDDNIEKLLREMAQHTNRKARFKTVIALIWNGQEHLFEGVVEGSILQEKTGSGGFGYDPVFMPIGFDQSFAQMDLSEKNKISHRGRAIQKLVDFFSND